MTPRTFRCISPTCLAVWLVFSSASSVAASDWRHFRGPFFDGSATAEWPEEAALRVAWKAPLGNGYAGIAAADGRLFTSYAADGSDWFGAYDAENGTELWKLRLGDELLPIGGGHGGPSATPVVGEGLVFAVGGLGGLVAASPDGREVWRRDLKTWGDPSPFGFASSPILARDQEGAVLVLQVPGRDGTFLVGLDPATGEDLWSMDQDATFYQTPIVATLAGIEQLVVSGTSGLHGITPWGEMLWSYPYAVEGPSNAKGRQINVPLPLGGDRILVRQSSENVAALEVSRRGDCVAPEADTGCDLAVREVWNSRSIARSYVPPVHQDGVIYGYRGTVLTAFQADDGSRIGLSRRPGDGFLAAVGDRLLVMTKGGGLHLGRFADVWDETAYIELFDDASWTEPTIMDGSVYLRSMSELARVEVVASDRTAEDTPWIGESRPGAELPDTRFGRFVRSLETTADPAAAIDEFLGRVDSFPIVEGEWAHFVHRSASGVGITGDMVGERSQFEMIRVPGTDLLYYTSRLPRDAVVSYLLFTDESEDGTTDPLNPRVTTLPREGSEFDRAMQHYSWFTMPDVAEPFYRAGASPATGRIETHRLDLSGIDVELQAPPMLRQFIDDISREEQRVRVYVPAGFDAERAEPYPLVLIFGGDKTLEGLDAKSTLDHVLGDELPQAVVAFVDRHFVVLNSDSAWSFELHRRSLFELILPLLRERYNVGDTHYLGFGYAGPIVLPTALADESEAVRIAMIQPFLLDIIYPSFVAGIDQLPAERRPRVYLETSRIDLRAAHETWDIRVEHKKVAKALADAGWDVQFEINSHGFFWSAWTDRLAPALAFLLTGDPEVPETDAESNVE